jgi:hypothetical protein
MICYFDTGADRLNPQFGLQKCVSHYLPMDTGLRRYDSLNYVPFPSIPFSWSKKKPSNDGFFDCRGTLLREREIHNKNRRRLA